MHSKVLITKSNSTSHGRKETATGSVANSSSDKSHCASKPKALPHLTFSEYITLPTGFPLAQSRQPQCSLGKEYYCEGAHVQSRIPEGQLKCTHHSHPRTDVFSVRGEVEQDHCPYRRKEHPHKGECGLPQPVESTPCLQSGLVIRYAETWWDMVGPLEWEQGPDVSQKEERVIHPRGEHPGLSHLRDRSVIPDRGRHHSLSPERDKSMTPSGGKQKDPSPLRKSQSSPPTRGGAHGTELEVP